MRHMSIARRGDKASSKRISRSSIKTRRNFGLVSSLFLTMDSGSRTDDQIRVKLLGNRHDDLLKGIYVVPITHSLTRPGYVDIPS